LKNELMKLSEPSWRAPHHFQCEFLWADEQMRPCYERLVHLLFTFFAMPCDIERIMRHLGPSYVDSDGQVLNRNLLHVAISEIKRFLKTNYGDRYVLKSIRKKGQRKTWAYQVDYHPDIYADAKASACPPEQHG
jgi:hypothetical protein